MRINSIFMPNHASSNFTVYLLFVGAIFFSVRSSANVIDIVNRSQTETLKTLLDSEVTKAEIRDLGQDTLPPGEIMRLKSLLSEIVQEGLDSMAFPGAQLLVQYAGRNIVDTVYGYHTYQQQMPVLYDDLYDLASLTKVTAALPALMIMIDNRLLHLDDNLCRHFPFLCGSNKGDITFRQALAHYGQLLPYIVYWQNTLRHNGKYRARTFRKLPNDRFSIKVTDSLYLHEKYKRRIDKAIKKSELMDRKEYVYSGLLFLLVPDLIQERTGMPLDEFLYKNVFDPIGAERLRYNPMQHFAIDEIVPTELDTLFRHQLVHGTVHDEAAAMLDGVSGNAGLFGNARDLAKLYQLYLNEGSYEGHQYIDSMTVRAFTQCAYCEEGNRRGLGFDKPLITFDKDVSYVARSATKSSYGHSGFTGTFFWVDPEHELIFVFLSNRVYPYRSNRKLYSMGIRPRLHQAVYDVILEHKKGNLKK